MRQVLFTIPIFGGIKVFGYGTMLVLAFIGSTWLATWRARREKLNPEVILDMAFWVFFIGMVGARLFYCIQYWGHGHRQPAGRGPVLERRHRLLRRNPGRSAGLLRLSPLPAVSAASLPRRHGARDHAVGTLFGRLGCFLNGCCYGDYVRPALGRVVPQALAPLGLPASSTA